MAQFQFRGDIPIDVPHTLNQLLNRFQSVRDGLAELVKNSKDQYSRMGITEVEDRVIVVVADAERKQAACIDFAGAEKEQFDRWQKWSDPDANLRQRATDIEGGHGNGGKAFMVHGSTTDSSFESVAGGRRTKMGYQNDPEHLYQPGYAIEDRKPINDVNVPDVRAAFRESLIDLALGFGDLPVPAQQVFMKRKCFTIVQINGVKEWVNARPETVRRKLAELPSILEHHPQAGLTIESCQVWFVINGQVFRNQPACIRWPEPLPGFDPRVFPVPPEMLDPQTDETILTGSGDDSTRKLTLRTSAKSLRTEDLRPLHVVRVRNIRNIVGLWSVADLQPGASSGFIFGELAVPDLGGDHLVGADRTSLADTPLVRALRNWTAEKIGELADRIQKATAKEHRPEDRDRVNYNLRKLRELMRKFLGDRSRGTEGAGAGDLGNTGTGGVPPPPPPPPPKGSIVHVIEIESGARSLAVAVGATIPLSVRAYELSETGERLPVVDPDITAKFDPPGVIRANEDGTITAEVAGTASLWFEPGSGAAECNRIAIESVVSTGATISDVPERLLLQGERVTLKIVYGTVSGPRDDLVSDASVDEIGMGRISRHGSFTAGSTEGIATIRVRFGPRSTDTSAATVRIGPDRITKRGRGGQDGGEIPLILLCGTEVPGMENYPPDQRSVPPSEYQPTIIDFEPEFEHVIFINPDSKESMQVRRNRGGRKGMASIATETYHQFIALKCFEILKRLRIFEGSRDGALTELQFRERFANAETECAPFIEEAYRIAEALTDSGSRT
jgi:hypothetical protein